MSGLRHRRGDDQGTREFVQVLQLHQQWPAERVEAAVEEALQFQVYSFEAVKHLLLRQQSPGEGFSPLAMDLIPGVTDRQVEAPDLGRYDQLLAGGVS